MQNLNCNQVTALLTFFIENKLNPKLMQNVEYHLNLCTACREKYFNLRKMLNNYQEIKNKIIEPDETEDVSYKEKQYKIFKENLSAYIDNELNDEENLRIRRISIANSDARQDLENILSFRELLKESFGKTADELKEDLSVSAIGRLYNISAEKHKIKGVRYIPLILCIVFIMIYGLMKILL